MLEILELAVIEESTLLQLFSLICDSLPLELLEIDAPALLKNLVLLFSEEKRQPADPLKCESIHSPWCSKSYYEHREKVLKFRV